MKVSGTQRRSSIRLKGISVPESPNWFSQERTKTPGKKIEACAGWLTNELSEQA